MSRTQYWEHLGTITTRKETEEDKMIDGSRDAELITKYI